MALSEKEIPELQEIYRRLFYKNYDINTYRFLGALRSRDERASCFNGSSSRK